jgi:CRISPR-associated protein Cmr6
MIPVSKNAGSLAEPNQFEGNFGLYYAKMTDLDTSTWKAFESHKGEALSRIEKIYKRCSRKADVQIRLNQLHQAREDLKQSFVDGYAMLTLRAKLSSRLVTGLGQAHPTETGMVYDRNLGIPYIPAASIKGLVRFSHKLINNLPPGEKDSHDADPKNLIPQIFGGKKIGEKKTEEFRGSVIFLDAYPEAVPELELDIMTPHFTQYYETGADKWPTDTINPVPVKFLTVKPGTVFIFHALLPKDKLAELEPAVRRAFEEALVYEGVGAKTAVGYGRFSLAEAQTDDPNEAEKKVPIQTAKAPEYDTKEYYLSAQKSLIRESEEVTNLYNTWSQNETLKQDRDIALGFYDLIIKYKKKGKKPTKAFIYLEKLIFNRDVIK